MASASFVEESVSESPNIDDRIATVKNALEELTNAMSNPNDDLGVSQIMNSSFLTSITDVRNEFVPLVTAKSPITNEQLECFEAFTCAAATLTLTKAFAWYTQDIQNHVAKKDHNDRLVQIKNIHKKVNDKLEDIHKKMKELKRLLKKVIRQGSDSGMDIEFNLQCEVIVNDLESCTSDLIHAKNQLIAGYDSIKEYVGQSCTRTGAAFAVASIAIPLFKIIGTLGATGIGGAVIGLGYTSYQLWTDCHFGRMVANEYKELWIAQGDLVNTLLNVAKNMEAFRNAKKLKDERQNKRIMEEQYKIEMMEKDNEIEELKAKIAKFEESNKPNH